MTMHERTTDPSGPATRPAPARRRWLLLLAIIVLPLGLAGIALGGQVGASPTPAFVVTLRTLNASGVSGTVSFTDLPNGRTRVTISVDPAGHPDMPAHVHPGTCDTLTPQPKYPLENVRDGRSTTEIAVTTAELLASPVAVNLHNSVSDLKTYTACAEVQRPNPSIGSASGAPLVINVVAADGEQRRFSPASISVPAFSPLRVVFRNASSESHNLSFTGALEQDRTRTIVGAGERDELTMVAPGPGSYTFVCSIHQGMTGELVVR